MICVLKEVRKSKGMTQAELSARSHVNRVSIAKYETGKSVPTIETAGRLAAALDVTIEDIVKAG